MPMLAVYIVPPQGHHLSEVGSAFLGYDIYRRSTVPYLLADVFESSDLRAWIGNAQQYGFHATIGDALDYPEELVPEIRERLTWIAGRVAPFTLRNGRVHPSFRNVPRTFVTTFDEPTGGLTRLELLVVTMINVLHRESPNFGPRAETYPARLQRNIARYGSPYVLNDFDLHFSFATSVPSQEVWDALNAEMTTRTPLFQPDGNVTLDVEHIHLLMQGPSGFYEIIESFPLTGEPEPDE